MMIDSKLLDKLKVITTVEKKFLDGESDIERSIYMQNSLNIVNSDKLLGVGKLISIRPHVRFVHFPEHSHDYIEIVYMCQGQTNTTCKR